MDFKTAMQEHYRRAYGQHPGLEQFRRLKKALFWGIMALFALQKLLIAVALGHPLAFAAGLLGLVLPAIFLLAAWRGEWKMSLLLLIPACTIGAGFFRDALPALLYTGGRLPMPVYLSVFVDAALVILMAGTVVWLTVPRQNREYSVILNRITEELIRLSKGLGGPAAAAPAPEPEPAKEGTAPDTPSEE